MGYTHYWRINDNLDPHVFRQFSNDCENIALASKVPLGSGSGEVGTEPIFYHNLVDINGIDKDSHENLFITPDDSGFNFCKTARKPYDKVVVACLICLKYHFNFVKLNSDGSLNNWSDGIELYKSVFPHRDLPNPILD